VLRVARDLHGLRGGGPLDRADRQQLAAVAGGVRGDLAAGDDVNSSANFSASLFVGPIVS